MTGDVAEALAAMLQQQPHLRALNLNDTSLEDAGVSTVAQALASSGDWTSSSYVQSLACVFTLATISCTHLADRVQDSHDLLVPLPFTCHFQTHSCPASTSISSPRPPVRLSTSLFVAGTAQVCRARLGLGCQGSRPWHA